MIEQDTAREAAYREWVAELKRQGEKERHQDIITAFNAAWAAGVAHGRAEALQNVNAAALTWTPIEVSAVSDAVEAVRAAGEAEHGG